MKAIDGRGELGLGRLLRLELVPQRSKLRRLVGRQQSEEALGGARLALVLIRQAGRVVGKRVAGIDLHDVVDEEHFQHAQHIELRRVGGL